MHLTDEPPSLSPKASPRSGGASRSRPGPGPGPESGSGAGQASIALVVGSMISVQCGAALATTLFHRLAPAGVVTMRLGIAAIVLFAVERPPLRGRTRRDWTVVAGFGTLIAAMNWCLYQAVARLPLGMAITIELLGPLGLAVALSRRRREVAWCGVAIAGVVLLGEGGHRVNLTGVAFALVAAVGWAGYILLSRETGRRFDGRDGVAIAMAIGSLAICPIAVVQSGHTLLTPSLLLAGAGVAMLSALIPFSLEVAALRAMPTRTFGVLMSLSPVAATLVGALFLDERLGGIQLVAIAGVVIASVATVLDG